MTMTLRPEQIRPYVDGHKVKTLGTLAGLVYVEHRGTEYAYPSAPVDPTGITVRPGQIVIRRRVTDYPEGKDGPAWEHPVEHVAEPVPTGTYERAAADAERRRSRRNRPATPRPLDLLAGLAVFHRVEPTRYAVATSADPLAGAMANAAGLPPLPVIEAGGHEAVERTPAAMLEHLRGRGVELSLSGGRLIVRARQPMAPQLRELLTIAEPLLVAALGGPACECAVCGQPAATVCFPSWPACAEHATN